MPRQKSYKAKLKDPRWKAKRAKILARDNCQCQRCGDDESPLEVHHGYYVFGLEPWDYPDEALHTYCETCHKLADQQRILLNCRIGCLSFEAREELLSVIEDWDTVNCLLVQMRRDV